MEGEPITLAPSQYRSQSRWELVSLFVLLALVASVWCTHYSRWKADAWQVPPLAIATAGSAPVRSAPYGEAFWGMAVAKARASGELGPRSDTIQSFGAPFGADQAELKSASQGVLVWWAILVRVFGLFGGSNILLLSAHLLAATSFFVVCSYLRYDLWLSCLGAALFALSPFAFWRGLPQADLTFYWHVPLGLLVAWWCLGERDVFQDRRKLLVAALIAFLHGVQNLYYGGVFLLFLVVAGLASGIHSRNWRRAIAPLGLVLVLLVSACVANADTLARYWSSNRDKAQVDFPYSDVELFGLKGVELLIPPSHSWSLVRGAMDAGYFKQAMFLGEAGSPYLGIIAIASLILLAGTVAAALARRSSEDIPTHFWGIVLVFAYSTIGGVTAILGLWHFFLLPATNRDSIVILAAALLFLVRQLTVLTEKWDRLRVAGLAALLLFIGLWDQLPHIDAAQFEPARQMTNADAELMSTVESQLPEGAMIFQLPARAFPEPTPAGPVTVYNAFRPYLHSQHLRFSYGAAKGTYKAGWQDEAVQLETNELVPLLEKYGFAALLVDRSGFEDGATALLEELRQAGKQRYLATSDGFVCVALNPVRRPLFPPVFEQGWYDVERTAANTVRWSSGNATVRLYNNEKQPRVAHLLFALAAIDQRVVTIHAGANELAELSLEADSPSPELKLKIELQPGESVLRFTTDRPARVWPSSDGREVAFRVVNFRLEE